MKQKVREVLEALAKKALPDETAEAVSYNVLKLLIGHVGNAQAEVVKLVDALIVDEALPEATTPEEHEAREEAEVARLEGIRTLCISILSSCSSIADAVYQCMPWPSDMVAMEGKRNSAQDQERLQQVHDHSVFLGAKCGGPKDAEAHVQDPPANPEPNPPAPTPVESEPKAAAQAVETEAAAEAAPPITQPCGCGEKKQMTKEQRDEAIANLTTCRFSGFTADDKTMLEAATDERLEAFLVAASSRKQSDEASREPKQLTEEEFLKIAPPSIKSLLSKQQKQETETKAALVTELKAAQDEYSEAELSAMNVDELMRLARVSKVQMPVVDFSGRAVSRAAMTKDNDVYANPPDPYAEALKKRK